MIKGQLSRHHREVAQPSAELGAELSALNSTRASNAYAIDADDDPIRKAAKDREQQQAQTLHDLSLGGLAPKVGVIATSASEGARREQDAKRHEEEKKRALDRAELLAMINARIDALNTEIAGYDEDLANINDAQAALNELEELFAKGEIDPNNPAHADLMRQAGITKDDLDNDPQGAFERQREYWEKEETRVLKKRDEAVKERDRYEQGAERVAEAKSDAEALEILNELENPEKDYVTATQKMDAEVVAESDRERGFTAEQQVDSIDALGGDIFSEADEFGFGTDDDFISNKTSFASGMKDDGGIGFEPGLSSQFAQAANGETSAPTISPERDLDQTLAVRP